VAVKVVERVAVEEEKAEEEEEERRRGEVVAMTVLSASPTTGPKGCRTGFPPAPPPARRSRLFSAASHPRAPTSAALFTFAESLRAAPSLRIPTEPEVYPLRVRPGAGPPGPSLPRLTITRLLDTRDSDHPPPGWRLTYLPTYLRALFSFPLFFPFPRRSQNNLLSMS
jgi:hypothetical protein